MPPSSVPPGESVLLIRTDFSDEVTWQTIVTATAQESNDGFLANVTIINDKAWTDATVQDIKSAHEGDLVRTIAFVVDSETMFDKEHHAILCVRLDVQKSSTLRVIPSELWSVENNLSLGNLDWEDFISALDEFGVFKGFVK